MKPPLVQQWTDWTLLLVARSVVAGNSCSTCRVAKGDSTYPLLAVDCIRRIIEGEKEGWRIYQWRNEGRKVLQAAKQSGDAALREAVYEVVNRLGARGFLDFRDLLS